MDRVTCWKGISSAWLIGLLLALPRASSQGEAELIFTDGFENHDPIITTSPITSAMVGVPYAYDVDASDIDGDTLLYDLTTSPPGMSINPGNGLIGWTPGAPGNVPVAVEVTDGQGGLAQQGWVLNVAAEPFIDGHKMRRLGSALTGGVRLARAWREAMERERGGAEPEAFEEPRCLRQGAARVVQRRHDSNRR